MKLQKRKCALKECGKIFVPDHQRRIYCCVECSHKSNYLRDKKRFKLGKVVQPKIKTLPNGIELINNVITQGIFPGKVIN